MKVKLIRAARIRHEAGEIVEVSPAEAGFLMSTGSAVRYVEPVQAEAEAPEAIETPETEEEAPEIPEKAVKAAKATTEKTTAPKTTRKKK